MKEENKDGDRNVLKICTQINIINNYTYTVVLDETEHGLIVNVLLFTQILW